MTKRRTRRVTRDGILSGLGALILVHETVLTTADRQWLILAGLALLGFPVFLHKDEKRRDGGGERGTLERWKKAVHDVTASKDDGEVDKP